MKAACQELTLICCRLFISMRLSKSVVDAMLLFAFVVPLLLLTLLLLLLLRPSAANCCK